MAPVAAPADAAPAAPIRWTPHVIDGHGLWIELAADTPITDGDYAGAHYAWQRRGPVFARAALGPAATLDRWRADLGERTLTFTETTVKVCLHDATRMETATPAETAEGYAPAPPGAGSGHMIMARTPARVHVAIGVMSGRQPLLLEWVVDADQREAHRADEQHFFASLRCT